MGIVDILVAFMALSSVDKNAMLDVLARIFAAIDRKALNLVVKDALDENPDADIQTLFNTALSSAISNVCTYANSTYGWELTPEMLVTTKGIASWHVLITSKWTWIYHLSTRTAYLARNGEVKRLVDVAESPAAFKLLGSQTNTAKGRVVYATLPIELQALVMAAKDA